MVDRNHDDRLEAVRHERLCALFDEAIGLDRDAQVQFVGENCEGDPGLRAQLVSMLELDSEVSRWLDITGRQGEWSRQVRAITGDGETPESIGPYEIQSVQGRGGMGVVYKARQPNPNRFVALKVIHQGLLSERTRIIFEREIEALARLRHESIAQIYEAGTAKGRFGSQPYFAMELVEGPTIVAYSASHALSMRSRVLLFQRVCDAVHHAHQRGVIHRDLKPGNILVDDSGVPKVVDFGIAMIVEDDASQGVGPDEFIGTMAYMSPEQSASSPLHTDSRSDVYSLGVILYELLCGRLPYPIDREDLAASMKTIAETPPNPSPLLPKDLTAILTKAMEKDPERRYKSASEFGEDLMRQTNSQPVLARHQTFAYCVGRFAMRHRATSLIISLALITTLFAGVVAVRAYREANDAWKREAASAEGARELTASLLGLNDLIHLRELSRREEDLWPCRPEKADDFEAWLSEAKGLVGKLPNHQKTYHSLAPRSFDGKSEVGADYHREQFRILINALEALGDQGGLIDSVADRYALADSIVSETIDAYDEEWIDAMERVSASEIYGFLELEPQVGLVPLGADLRSGLEEFLLWESHPQSESSMNYSPKDILNGSGRMEGIILVLVPGGEFVMGSVDPLSRRDESPKNRVSLNPFFISKFEFTQLQWTRLMGNNPSTYQSTPNSANTENHPVETVSYAQVKEAVKRLDLELPTEAQWEYACGAGSSNRWHVENLQGLEATANLRDLSWLDAASLTDFRVEEWRDGWALHAPVGSFEANAFGLKDTLGNVHEWCLDFHGSYEISCRKGDGLRPIPSTSVRVFRGGCHTSDSNEARITSRFYQHESFANQELGFRPIRILD